MTLPSHPAPAPNFIRRRQDDRADSEQRAERARELAAVGGSWERKAEAGE